jgi:hypothetical protein
MMGLFVFAALVLACNRAWPHDLLDESVRARMLKHADGRIAHLETEYNNLYIDKGGPLLSLSTRVRNQTNFHSIVDLADPDAMPVPYARTMPAALLYAQTIQHILMVGLGRRFGLDVSRACHTRGPDRRRRAGPRSHYGGKRIFRSTRDRQGALH